MKTRKIIGIIIGGLFLTACAQQTDADKLKAKRSDLKAQIDALDAQLALMDDVEEMFLPLVQLELVSWGDFHHKISVQGNVETDKEIMLNTEMSGLIERIAVKEGQSVSAGQVLAVIDAEILNSNIQEVETQLDFAQYALDKQEELKRRGLGTEFEYKQALTQLNALTNQLQTLKKQRDKSIVKAPFAGVVDQVFPKEGEITGPQQPLLRLVNNKEVRITADISERHYNTVTVGTDVKVYVPTLRDTMQLTITNVGNYIHPTNRTFRVRADLSNNERLLPNMLAQLVITDLTLDSVLVIPSAAILKSQLNEDYVLVARPDKEGNFLLEEVIVQEISKYDGQSAVEVLRGELKEADKVVTRGGRGVTPGDRVRIQ
jgi:RND family efflux transporter MFP subunit